jgi:uncharacterized protein (TIGR00251 family)
LEHEAKISLRVYPNAPKNEVTGFTDELLRVRIAAPPVKGKANRELLSFLRRFLKLGPEAIAITRGHTSRNKTIRVTGLTQEELVERILNG